MKLCSYHISLELFLHSVFLVTMDFRAVLPVLLMDIKVSCRGPVKSDVAVSAVVRACSCAYVRMSVRWRARSGIAVKELADSNFYVVRCPPQKPD